MGIEGFKGHFFLGLMVLPKCKVFFYGNLKLKLKEI